MAFYRHFEEESIPKLIDISKHIQETLEDQMFHNRRTLQEIARLRKYNIQENVISFYFLNLFLYLNYLLFKM
jgi:hypothetical protein